MRPKALPPLVLMGLSLITLWACGDSMSMENLPPAEPGELQRRAIEISAKAVPLNPEDPAQTKIGGLTYLRGWSLTSSYPRFGGFSGMALAGNRLIAISDRGDWLLATVDWRNKAKPFSDAQMMPFAPGVADDKKSLDAESLTRAHYGYLVGFEYDHRVVHVWEPGAQPGLVPALNLPDFNVLEGNHGIEAMTLHPSGQALLFAEYSTNRNGDRNFWAVDSKGAINRGYREPRGHAPTDAITLPNGGVLVLNRNYSPIDGNSIIVMEVPNSVVTGTGPLIGRQVAQIAAPLTVDNMEALVYVGDDAGRPIIAMLSDNNFRSAQRTLLMLFRLDG